MARIQPIDVTQASGKAKELLDAVQKKLGKVPNMFRVMAQAPAVLESYLSFSGALGHATLSAKVREQIALATGEANHCDYCLAAHSTIGKAVGLPEAEVTAARRGTSSDPKTAAVLELAGRIVRERGNVGDEGVRKARAAGLSDAEILETVAAVSLNIFTNYFNHLADPEVDFPKAGAI